MGHDKKLPRNMQSDGIDVEFSAELADHDDVEAMARAEAADKRAAEVAELRAERYK